MYLGVINLCGNDLKSSRANLKNPDHYERPTYERKCYKNDRRIEIRLIRNGVDGSPEKLCGIIRSDNSLVEIIRDFRSGMQ